MASAVAVGALFATLSRGPLAIFVVSVIALLVWRRQLSLRTVAYGLVGVAAVSVPFLLVGVLREYVADTLAMSDSSTIARFANVTARIATLAEHPWLGTGISSATRGGDIGGAESEWLQIALRFGLVGLGCYLLLVGSLIRRFWRGVRQDRRTELIWGGVSVLILNLYAMINPMWRSGFHTMVIWMVWGVLATQVLESPPAGGIRESSP